jgi:hypothetical protein
MRVTRRGVRTDLYQHDPVIAYAGTTIGVTIIASGPAMAAILGYGYDTTAALVTSGVGLTIIGIVALSLSRRSRMTIDHASGTFSARLRGMWWTQRLVRGNVIDLKLQEVAVSDLPTSISPQRVVNARSGCAIVYQHTQILLLACIASTGEKVDDTITTLAKQCGIMTTESEQPKRTVWISRAL